MLLAVDTGAFWFCAVLAVTCGVLIVDLFCGLKWGDSQTLSDHVRDWAAHWPWVKFLYLAVFGFLFFHFFMQHNAAAALAAFVRAVPHP